MAHFAELIQKTDPPGHTSDKLWVVERVVVVGNEHARRRKLVFYIFWWRHMETNFL